MPKKIIVWNDQKDELLCREILVLEPYKFKARTREWKAIADNLNFLDGFKVDVRAVRERYGVNKAHFKAKEKEEKMASGINPEVTPLYNDS